MIANACPHRGASLFFGRNEEEGLRCVYHGWKFDVDGTCVDMPSSRPRATSRPRSRAAPTRCVERNGIVWTYMGPRETPPPLPELAAEPRARLPGRGCACRSATTCRRSRATSTPCTSASCTPVTCGPTQYAPGQRRLLRTQAARGALRRPGARDRLRPTPRSARPRTDTDYWRTGHFLLPFYTMNAPGVLPHEEQPHRLGAAGRREHDGLEHRPPALLTPRPSGIGGLKVG